MKSKHPLLYRREKDRLTTNARQVWRPDLRLELKFLVYWEQDVENRRVIFDILPCVVKTSLETDAFMAIIGCIDMLMVRRNISKFRSKEVYSVESWANDIERFGGARYTILRTHLVRKGPSRGVIQKGEPHERSPCAPKFEERTPEETSRQEECARKAAWDLARKIFKLKAEDKATFYSPVEIKAPVLVSKNTEERMFVVDLGASMHMLSKKDLSSDEMDTLRRSRNPTTVVTANGEVQTNEEAQVNVQDLDLFVTVQLLEEFHRLVSFLLRTRMFIRVEKRRHSTCDPKWEDNYLYNG